MLPMTEMFELSDRATNEIAAADPVEATFSGVTDYNDRWPDLSPDGVQARRAMWARIRDEAHATTVLDDRDRLAQEVLIDECDAAVQAIDDELTVLELNNIECTHQNLRLVFGSMDASSEEGWTAILARLETIDEPVAGYRRLLDRHLDSGRTVARRQVDAVLDQGQAAVGPNSLFHQLEAKLVGSPLEDAAKEAFRPRLESALAGAKTAFAELNRYLETSYRPRAREADGVGRDVYASAARLFLGTDMDLELTYRWGWDEVERLWAEMRAMCAELDRDKSVEEVMHDLQTSPRYGVATEAEFIGFMTERQQVALEQLDNVHFDVPAQIRTIDIAVEPPGGSLGAHYVPPSEDFSRPGCIWYPVQGQDHFPLFDQVSTSYHEGFPGHHLQGGVQLALRDELSRFHRTMVFNSGSGEGWALYVERFMDELGFLERPEYRIGLLAMQMMRSCRIAIDIGVHLGLAIPGDVGFHPGEQWSFELACELLRTRALLDEASAAWEVTRYFGWPGQAISYKVGEQVMLDLRDRLAAQPDFDLKRFHANVLAVGMVGLDLLQRRLTS